MNKIWIFIIIFSLLFGFMTGNVKQMIGDLFLVPQKTLEMLLHIGSMLIIYSGLFQIAIDSKVIKKLSKLIIKPVSKVFKINNEELLELICASIIANMLGLGPANMAIAMKIMDKLKDEENHKYYNLTMYLMINVSSLCLLPLSTLTYRETFGANISIEFIPMLLIASALTTLVAILIVKIGCKNE